MQRLITLICAATLLCLAAASCNDSVVYETKEHTLLYNIESGSPEAIGELDVHTQVVPFNCDRYTFGECAIDLCQVQVSGTNDYGWVTASSIQRLENVEEKGGTSSE